MFKKTYDCFEIIQNDVGRLLFVQGPFATVVVGNTWKINNSSAHVPKKHTQIFKTSTAQVLGMMKLCEKTNVKGMTYFILNTLYT